MSFRERRRSTPLPAGSEPTVDFQTATEAMQRAADAMIAATESFRQQFHQQDINVPGSHGSHSSEGSGSGSGSGTNTTASHNNRAASAASHRTISSGRRRPMSYQHQTSYQPYRPPSADAVLHSPVDGSSMAAAARPKTAGHHSATHSAHNTHSAHAYPPPVHRNSSTTPTLPKTVSPPNNPYNTYRAARASSGSPAPPISFHNNATAAAAATTASSSTTTPALPMSDYYTVHPDGTASVVPRDDSGIAMTVSNSASANMPQAAQPLMLNNPTIRLVELPGPLAMHPLSMDPQQPPRALQQQAHQQQQVQSQQADVTANEVVPSTSSAPTPASRASHASWSLMPKIPKTPDATSGPSRRLTPPVLPPAPPSTAVGTTPTPGAPISSSHSPVGGRRPSMSSYIDLMEAASRLKRTHSYQGVGHAGELIPRDSSFTPVTDGEVTAGETTEAEREHNEKRREREHESEAEPEPVLQIGRYTYIRSEAGDHDYRASLIRDDGSRRYTTRPVTRNSLVEGVSRAGSRVGSRVGSLRRRQSGSRRMKKEPSPDAPYGFSLMHESMFVLIICLSQVLMLAGIAQALIPANLMSLSFPDATPGNIAWYTAAYGLTSGTFVLPSGRLGDLFGHRRIFIIGFVWFAAWSLLAGFAPAIQHSGSDAATSHRGTTIFIICRAMQGIGPAMLVPNGQAMLGRAYAPGPRKNIVMSLFGASSPLGFVVGAVMSALFAIYASWPWAFWTLAAVCVALAAVSMLVLPPDDVKEDATTTETTRLEDDDTDDVVISKKSKMAVKKESLWVRMDGMGILLGVAGLVLVNFAFNQAPIVGWATPYTYFLLILGLFFVAAFLYVEAFQAAYPLVPTSAMHSTTNFVLGCTATGWGCFSVWVYYVVQMFENLRGWSPLMTSAAFAPAPVTGLIASLLTGFLFSRRVKPHWVMLLSMFAFFVGSLLFATSAPDQLYWYNPFFSILIMPFGMDMSNPAAIILVSNSVRREHQGIAASLVVTFVNYAISLALGIAGSVEAGVFDPDNLLVGYRAAQYFGLGLGGLSILFGTAFLCQSYLRAPPTPQVTDEKTGGV